MQNYNNFIDELFTLDVSTKERFVCNGRVLFSEEGYPDPFYYPADSDAVSHPNYYRATFLNISHYNDHNETDRYEDKLRKLMKAAETDVLILTNEQTGRILANARKMRDDLTELVKKSLEFTKALKSGTLDDPLFLELKILPSFNIKHRPQASPEERFAHDLYMTIAYKRGALSGFIKQVEDILATENKQISPTATNNQTQVDLQTTGPLPSNIKPLSDEDKKQQVINIMAPLGGLNPRKQRIMSEADYAQLIRYTNHLVITESLPLITEPFPQTGISNEHIRYTFYRLHVQLFGTRKIHQAFIDFLHRAFRQFEGTATSTTKAKFSHPPKSYEKDFAGYIGEMS